MNPRRRITRRGFALREAIGELQYGVGTKTMLQCDDRPWREQSLSGSALTDLPIGMTWDETDTQKGAAGILMAYTSAARGVDFSDLSDDERIDAAARDAEELFPGVRSGRRVAREIERRGAR